MFLLSAGAVDVSGIVLDIAIILIAGLILGRLAEKIKIPSVTGYLVAGLLIGPISGLIFSSPIITHDSLNDYHIISNIALGFIAFQVGNELWLGKLRKTGMKIVVITVIQAIATTGLVIILLLFVTDVPIALTLGAIAAATAPAPIMMIVKKYRTKGELTDTIIPVVGLDDAIGVILFGILLSISVSIAANTGEAITMFHLIKEPVIEIGYSILIGTVVGVVAGLALKTIDHNTERSEKNLNVVIIAVFFTTGLSLYFHASPILTPMIAGAIVTNLLNKDCYKEEEHTIIRFIPPLMILFFTIAGAELQFDVIAQAGMIGAGYIVGRILGKYFGSMFGCKITKSSKNVSKYLGLSLLPQSGVAIGLSIAAFGAFEAVNLEYADTIKNVTLAAVLVFELFGPFLVKMAFQKSGEITLDE